MFGKRFKRIRVDLKLSQEQLGAFFNVSAQCISYWESDKRDIPNNVLLKIQDLCKGQSFTPMLFLFGRCDAPFDSRGITDVIRYSILNAI